MALLRCFSVDSRRNQHFLTWIPKLSDVYEAAGLREYKDVQAALNEQERMLTLCNFSFSIHFLGSMW